MSEDITKCFAQLAPAYRKAGFWPRPIQPGLKACMLPQWQRQDSDISRLELDGWLTKYASHGIGLLMGSPFPDGTTLGALDIDRDEYVRLGAALLQNPTCSRVGKKGAVFFVRIRGKVPGRAKFKVTGELRDVWGDVAECLFSKSVCVLPPTQHPEVQRPYTWTGLSLLEINFTELPVVLGS